MWDINGDLQCSPAPLTAILSRSRLPSTAATFTLIVTPIATHPSLRPAGFLLPTFLEPARVALSLHTGGILGGPDA
jgi:hypothetical protein